MKFCGSSKSISQKYEKSVQITKSDNKYAEKFKRMPLIFLKSSEFNLCALKL